MAFRFLHLADLHLDSAYGGSPATALRLRQATLEALERAATFAIEAELDAVLIAGDAFDDDRLGYESRAVLRREIGRLAGAGVSVVYATGNHDPGTATGRAAGLRLAPTGGGRGSAAPIHVVLGGEAVRILLRHRGGEPAAIVVAAGHDTSRVTDNLAARMRPLLEEAGSARALPLVGLLHTQVGSAAGADGHAPYAPCSVADLLACGAHYWALGHVHVRGRVDDAVPAYYAGNLQGRHAKEIGPKGGLLVELDADGLDGEPEFIAFAPVEFFTCHGEFTRNAEPEEVAERIASALDEAASKGSGPVARELAIRIVYGGALSLRSLSDDYAAAVKEEVQRRSGASFGDILDVELRAGSATARADVAESREELLRELERAPSALREALTLCRERDAAEGTRLVDALLERVQMGRKGAPLA